jgi:hypothetical protein
MKGVATSFFATLAFGAFVAILYVANFHVLTYLTTEDGILEDLSAVFYLAAAIAFAYLSLTKPFSIGSLALAAIFFVLFGEEISWGQRIFGWGTPGELQSINVQGETNIHNLDALNGNVRMVGMAFFIGLYIFLPVLARKIKFVGYLTNLFKVPIPPFACMPILIGALVLMALPRLFDLAVFQLDEAAEFLLSVCVLAHAWHAVRGGRPLGYGVASQA